MQYNDERFQKNIKLYLKKKKVEGTYFTWKPGDLGTLIQTQRLHLLYFFT